MKLKTLLIVFLFSLMFLTTQSSSFESSDMAPLSYELCAEVSEQVEEIEDNRNFLLPTLSFSYGTLDSDSIIYEASFFLHDYFIDIEKPPINS